MIGHIEVVVIMVNIYHLWQVSFHCFFHVFFSFVFFMRVVVVCGIPAYCLSERRAIGHGRKSQEKSHSRFPPGCSKNVGGKVKRICI